MEGLQFVMYYVFLCYDASQQQQQYICLKFNFLRKSFSFLKCHSTTSQKNKQNKENNQRNERTRMKNYLCHKLWKKVLNKNEEATTLSSIVTKVQKTQKKHKNLTTKKVFSTKQKYEN